MQISFRWDTIRRPTQLTIKPDCPKLYKLAHDQQLVARVSQKDPPILSQADRSETSQTSHGLPAVQIEGALNALRGVTGSTGDTEDMVRLSVKLQRARLGPYYC